MSERDLETTGPGGDAGRIGQAPTTKDVGDPERASRNTAAGTGSGRDDVEPAADFDVHPEQSIEPRNESQR